MESPSRRAFLTGRRVTQTPWEAFIGGLRRCVDGTVYDFEADPGSARLVPSRMMDVYHARRLCAEHAVTLALDGVPHAARLDEGPVLWVEPGSALGRFERMGEGDTRWFVQPGCLIGELEAAGLAQFRDLPPHLTVAAWLADREWCDWDAGHTADSGLVHALLLLDDGTQANLGAFGAHNQKPLDNLRVQQMIPRLFEFVGSGAGVDANAGADVDAGAGAGAGAEGAAPHSVAGPDLDLASGLVPGVALWPSRYRLDALRPVQGRGINLAQLLLGHGGDLGWVEWVVLDERAQPMVQRPFEQRWFRRTESAPPDTADAAVKRLFDPGRRFPDPCQRF